MLGSSKRVRAALAGVGVIAGASASASAANITYLWDNGGASGNWSNGAGWKNVANSSTGTAPSITGTNGDIAQLNNGSALTVDGAQSAMSLFIATATGGSGTVSIGPGSSLALNRLYDDSNSAITTTTSGTINQTGGAVTADTQVWIGGENGTPTSVVATGIYNLSGGTATFTSSVANTRIARNGSTGTVNQTGGTWTSNGLIVSSQPTTGTPVVNSKGTYSISGSSTLTLLGRLYISAATISGGTNGTDTAVATGGDGTFNVTGSTDTINTYGYVQGAGGKLNFVADTGGLSTINVSNDPGALRGETSLAGLLSVDLTAMTVTPAALVLINNTSANLVSTTFSNAPEGTIFGNYKLTYAYTAGGDAIANDVALVAVPEPASMLAVMPLAAMMLRRRRRA